MKLICFDLEMACWENRGPGEIIEIGIAEIDFHTKCIVRTSQFLVRPSVHEISTYCTNLTGHTAESLKCEKPFNEVLASIKKQYSFKTPWCAFGNDTYYLNKEIENKNSYIKFDPVIMRADILYKMYTGKNENDSLEKALNTYDMQFSGEKHSGVADAYNLARLMLKIIDKTINI